MRRIQKILSVILAIMMVISIVPITASAAPDPYSGVCGDNLTWSYDEATGTLTISGDGAMYDYPFKYYDFKSETINVVIEYGVTSIGDSAFELFVNLKSVTIPESVTVIGDYAFDECDSLTKIVLHEGITRIGEGAFSNCDYLDTVVIPGTVTEFGDDVFANCDRLANVTLCDGLTDIGTGTFANCTSLTDIVIPESVTSLRGENFAGCVNLKSITFSVNVETVGYGTFGDCINLQDVYYTGTEEDLLHFESMPYGKNEPLLAANIHCESTVHRHNYVKTGEYVAEFCDEDGYTTYTCECGHTYNGDYVKATEHNYDNGVVTTKPTCDADGVKTFTCTACGDTYTESVPKTGHSYDDGVVTTDPTCTTEGVKTFTCTICGDTYTESVDKVKEHDYQLVVNTSTGCVKTYKCSICGDTYTETVGTTHTQVITPEFAPTETKPGLTAGIACSGCGAVLLEQEIIPALGTTEDSSVIVSGTCGTNATWTYNTKTGALIISGTGAMERYKSVQNKPWERYEDDIKSVVINNGITKIDNYTFDSCSSLMYVSIPDSVTAIGSNVFKNCTSLRSVVIPDSVTSLSLNAFTNCSKLIDVTLSKNISTIEDELFKGCSSLTHVTVPDSVYYINAGAFAGCTSLKSVTIGKKVEIIYNNAFNECTSLTDVYYTGTEEQWKEISINTTGNDALTNATIHYNSAGNIGGTEHKHNYKVETLDPTCTEDGYISYTCDCGYEYSVVNKALGHTIEEIAPVLPTTTQTGLTRGEKCSTCGEAFIKQYEVPAIDENDEAGAFSENLVWVYEESTRTLTIYGDGYMDEYNYNYSFDDAGCPWDYYRYSIEKVVIKEGVKSIGNEAFYSCYNLKTVTIGKDVKYIGENNFIDCASLESISVNSNNANYSSENGVLFDKNKTKLICYPKGKTETMYTVPDSVTIIGVYAFYNCDNLIHVTLGDNVTNIHHSVFRYSKNLKTITIPRSLQSVGECAFQGQFITDVFYLGTEEEWSNIYDYGSNSGLFYAKIHYNYNAPFTGIKDNHFYKDDVMQKAYQLVEFDGDFYFIGDRHEIVKNKKVSLTEVRINGLTYADGSPILPGSYNFDEDGKMIILNGVVGKNIYKNNTKLKAYQLVEVDGEFYFIGDRHEIVKNQKVNLTDARINGLTYADGTPILAGVYEFDENGKMIMREGIVGNYVYKNNVQQKAYQLVEIDGDFYFIGDRHEIIKGRKVYLSEEKINGLTYADGTPIAVGSYDFDENGKMIILNGIVGNNVYKNNTKLKAYQLVEVDGDFYFIGDRHEIVKNKRIYLNEERINGLAYADGTPITVGNYNVDADGKLIIE